MIQTLPVKLPALKPADVRLVDDIAWVDGIECRVDVEYEPADPSVGVPESYGILFLGQPRVADRQAWDETHAPVAPTATVMRHMLDAAADELAAIAEQRAKDSRLAVREAVAEFESDYRRCGWED